MKNIEHFNKIKAIGRSLLCTDEELMFFLPNYPTLRGSEFIFTIGWANAKEYIDNDVEYFVKGLHKIEEKYKIKIGSDFGFGSPSPTFKIIEQLEQTNNELAIKLKDWIAQNGGNYYIPTA